MTTKDTVDDQLDRIILGVRNYYSGFRSSENLPIPCFTDLEAKAFIKELLQRVKMETAENIEHQLEQEPDAPVEFIIQGVLDELSRSNNNVRT